MMAGMCGVYLLVFLLVVYPLHTARGTSSTLQHPDHQGTDREAHELMTSFWKWHLEEFPEFSTEVGVHDYDDKVTEYTEEAFRRRMRKASDFLAAIHQLGNHGNVSHVTRTSLVVMEDMLNTFMEGFEFRFQTVYLPCQTGSSFVRDWSLTLEQQRLTSQNDYEKLLQRYTRIPYQVQEMVNLTQTAMNRGYLRNAIGLQHTIDSLRDHITRAEDSLFYKPFINMPDVILPDAQEQLRERAVAIIKDNIMPQMWKYWLFMKKKYLPAAKSVPIGVYALPDGRDLYLRYLNYHLSERMTPEQVHQLGLAEVEQVTHKIHKLVRGMGDSALQTDKNVGNVIRHLLNDSQLYFNDSDSMLEAYKLVSKDIHRKLDEILPRIPSIPYMIKPTFSGPDGTYHDPTNSTQGAGVFFANVASPHGPMTNLLPVLLHELEPGHHTQSSYLDTSRVPLPLFRRKPDFTNAFAVPFHLPLYTAYAEGWALYAEMLGEQMGLFDEPLLKLGRYANEMLRACRLVVDTGIHAFGWSRWVAEDYLINNAGLTSEKAAFEVNRYIARPGQACAYKIGERKILEIRRRAEEVAGPHFDLREFHDRLLTLGPVPLHLLEREMYTWINDVKTGYTISDDVTDYRSHSSAYIISNCPIIHNTYNCHLANILVIFVLFYVDVL